MERLQYLKPIHPFRSQFEYSNVNFAAMGYVVELITGKSYYDVLDEWIFQPLDMAASSDYAALRDSGAEISQGYVRQGIDYTLCAADLAALTNATGADAELASLTLPESCAGTAEAFEFWTNGSGQEWGAGGNVIATGTDLVRSASYTHLQLSTSTQLTLCSDQVDESARHAGPYPRIGH